MLVTRLLTALAVLVLRSASATGHGGNHTQNVHVRSQGPQHINLLNTNPGEWAIDIVVGDQSMKVQIDTGSPALFLWSPACADDECAGNPRYQPRDGAHTDTGGEIEFPLQKETAVGWFWKDSFAIAGIAGTIEMQDILVATSGDVRLHHSLTGLMGWGWPEKTATTTTIWLNYLEQFTDKQFAFYFGSAQGQMTVGGYNLKCMENGESSIGWTNVILPHDHADGIADDRNIPEHWNVVIDSVSAKGVSLMKDRPVAVAIDTGDSTITLPIQMVEEFFETFLDESAYHVNDYHQYMFPCTEQANIPDLVISIGDNAFTVPGSKLVSYNDVDTGMCTTRLVGKDRGRTLGRPFLSSVYTVFDASLPNLDDDTSMPRLDDEAGRIRPRIGFAEVRATAPCV